jgi:hypothetical protein
MKTNRIFRLVLIKPSHYDTDGYVIRWWRGGLPSNSLACLYGIALECRQRQILGADFDIDIEAIDETNWKVRVEDLTRSIKAADAGMVMLVGVQSNQFPRSLDIAKQFRSRGIQVAIGGFHVSGTLSMLPERDPGVQEMMDLGVSVFAGEAEGRLEGLLQDAVAGKLQPLYNFLGDLPHLEGQPLPIIPRQQIERVTGHTTSFDAGRGCPFQCSFCTIINVQGRKSRRRTADDIEADPRQRRAGHLRLLHHRRQFCAQQGLGDAARSDHRTSREGGVGAQLHDPGRYALPQAAELH